MSKIEPTEAFKGNIKSFGGKLDQVEQKKQDSGIEPIFIAYLEIYKSVQLNHEMAAIQTKEIQANNKAQNNLINQEALLNFTTVRQSVIDGIEQAKKNTFLQEINTRNQKISAIRSNFENKLTVLKQNAQVSETKVNTVINESQQTISQCGNLMNMLVSLSQQVTQI
ncbi:MAG: DUF720 domain-containing protein [Chlamydiales bacterium]